MRGGFKVTKCSDERPEKERETELKGWLKNFAERVVGEHKTAVEVVRHTQPSIYDQLNQIMNGKKRLYSSVEEAVKDYQEKTGLKNYLNQISAGNKEKIKNAAAKILAASEEAEAIEEKKNLTPEIFNKHPYIETYIENVIAANPYIKIPVLLHKIGERFARAGIAQVDLDDPALARYINNVLIEQAPPISPNEFISSREDVDSTSDYYNPINNDPFIGLRPSGRY